MQRTTGKSNEWAKKRNQIGMENDVEEKTNGTKTMNKEQEENEAGKKRQR